MKVYQEALQACLSLPDGQDHAALGNLYIDISINYINQGDTIKGRDYIDMAISIFTKTKGKNSVETAGAYQNIGAIEEMKKNYPEALKYLGKSLEMFQFLFHDRHPECSVLYFAIGRIHSTQQRFDKAQEYY